ncbi:hemagglutinin repeat-containing protein [Shimwellia blattae]|uniref:Filamentous hemagglutinin family outer membrane protein n=2 Tax=Shimwellia blattae TaxID=563 RepID=I2B8E3_SHIBC|nr:hemagglutinin repeat-containing protein [Shimwellia blattae]AFJ46797.1 filamentous hemagglutinin family outer membrane protein [Shimwellia blattae DSM 4481 = NBRC 105725]VDY64275.1 Hemolysin precursor [Shimwellia blattae]VEC22400.1 Hemolysin precursor [Shimwellia blattae]
MNRLCYRVVFNQARQMLMVAPELARITGSHQPRGAGGGIPHRRQPVRPLALMLWLAMGWVSVPVSASTVISDRTAPGHQRPTVLETRNGIPQINIRTPDNRGLSHNKYTQFDIDSRGAVLNNSPRATTTRLAGSVSGNPWLAKGSARVILNEVTGRSPSQLNGFIEVAGREADVIIASPAGITCNGCGFINAAGSTLAAGRPVMNAGQLSGFEVDKGRIAIEGRGLNGNDQAWTRLIARAVEVNARVQARSLQVTTGRNQTLPDGAVSQVAAADDAGKPRFSLDVSALGGMYAGKIALTGTEKGVGVHNAGEIGAFLGELQLSADGKLTNKGTMYASQNLELQTAGLTNHGLLGSDSGIQITNRGDMANSGMLRAAEQVTVSNRGALRSQGEHLSQRGLHITADSLDLRASRSQSASVVLAATQGDIIADEAHISARHLRVATPGELSTQRGKVSAEQIGISAGKGVNNAGGLIVQSGASELAITTPHLNNHAGSLTSAGSVTLVTGMLINQHGELGSHTGNVSIETGHLAGTGGTMIAAQALRIFGGDIVLDNAFTRGWHIDLAARSLAHQQGKMLQTGGGDALIRVRDGLNNQQGYIVSLGGLKAEGQEIHNQQGVLSATAGGLFLHAGQRFNNQAGRAESGRDLTLTARETDNRSGIIQSADGGVISGGQFDNSGGKLLAARGPLVASLSGGIDNQSGVIASGGSFALRAGGVNNRRGLIQAADALFIDSGNGALNNTDTLGTGTGIRAGGVLELHSGDTDNRDGLIGAGTLLARAGRWYNQGGEVISRHSMALHTREWMNQSGLVSARGGELEMHVSGGLDNQRGTLQSGHALRVSADRADNTGGRMLAAGGDMAIRVTRELHNLKGTIASHGNTLLRAAMLDNTDGTIFTAAGRLVGQIAGQLRNHHGVIESKDDTGLSAGMVDNHEGALLSGGALLVSAVDALENQHGDIVAARGLRLLAETLNNQDGVIQSHSEEASLEINGDMTNRQGMILGEGVSISSQQLDNREGLLQASRQLSIDTRGHSLQNTGSQTPDSGIRSGGALTLSAGELVNQQGLVASAGVMELAGDIRNTEGQILSHSDLTVHGTQLVNQQGQLVAGRDLQARMAELNNQGGSVLAVGSGLLAVARLIQNTGGFIRAGESLTLSSERIENQETRTPGKGIEAQRLLVSAGALDNTRGALRAAAQLRAEVAGRLNNTLGVIWSRGTITLGQPEAALHLVNDQGDVVAVEDMALFLRGLDAVGRITSAASVALKITGALIQNGTLAAGKDLEIRSGDVTNSGLIHAGQRLVLNSDALVNQQAAEISAGQAWISASRLLNLGLLDGGLVTLITPSLHNTGSGRIYGDDVVIDARQLLNDMSEGTAATIAGRRSVSIATERLQNRDHALIYSEGSLVVGNRWDEHSGISGRAASLENHSATLEATGPVVLAAGVIDNRDIYLAVTREPQPVGVSDWIDEYRYCAGDRERVSCHGGDGRRYVMEPDWINGERRALNPDGSLLDNGRTKLRLEGGKNIRRQRFFLPGFEPSKHFWQYRYQVHTSETRVLHRDPALIRSGGDLILQGNLQNQNSRVVAGNRLMAHGQVHNLETQGERITTQQGTTTSWFKRGDWHTSSVTFDYQGEQRREMFSLNLMQFTDHAGEHAGQTVASREAHGNLAQMPAGGQQSSAIPESGHGPQLTDIPLISPSHHDPALAQLAGSEPLRPAEISGGTPVVIDDQPLVARTVSGPETVPDSSLFTLNAGTDSSYLVETDPRFTRQKTWLSSGDIYSADQLNKRLGDGYYEQKRVREQLLQATGQRFLAGYQDDETQYRDLLNQGRAFAERYGIKPGIALTAEQMALLTSDIVWMVNQPVTLPDGSVEVVSVPRLYVRVKPGDLQGNGALLSGRQVVISGGEALVNSGTIRGQEMTRIHGDNLLNQGVISGDQVTILARNNIINQGGQLRATERLWLQAGNDILSQTESRQQGSERWLDRQAGIYVQGERGELHLQAMRDIRLVASEVDNRGQASQTRLLAGRDLHLDSATESHSTDYTLNRKNYDRTHETREQGSRINAGGSLWMNAAQDMTLHAAEIASGGQLTAVAGRNLHLESGADTREHAGRAKWTSGGFLSKTTREHLREEYRVTARSTTLSGDSVSLQAGQDLRLDGSHVAGRGDVSLVAGRDLTLTTADEAWHQNDIQRQKKSGLTGNGGLGFNVGSASQKLTRDTDSNMKKGSVVGSSAGDVSLTAGNTVRVHGSDLVAGRDLSVTGAGIAITAAQNSHTTLTRTESHASGFSLALSGSAGSGVNTLVQQARAAGREEDPRLAALRGIQAALNAVRTGQGILLDQAGSSHNYIGLSLSYGSQHSRAERKTEQLVASGSSLTAGRNMLLTATQGDILARGATLNAGGDASLYARQDLLLASATDKQTVTGKNKSQGSSAGGSVSSGGGAAGVSATNTRLHSRYQAVQQQSGLFAGEGGFDITVGNHTQLNGAVIGSDATADKNRLETGTLGFSDLHNRAEFTAQQQSAGISTGGSLGGLFLGNMASTLLAGVNHHGNAGSSTQAAVSEGQILIRDPGAQQQDLNLLSRDVSGAHRSPGRIFDGAAEQRRLQQAQLLAETGVQAGDIARTQGEINGLKAAQAQYPGYTPEQLRDTAIYKAEVQKYGTGSAIQQGIQAATAAIQGLAGGNLAQALTGAGAPYLASQIHRLAPDEAARAMAHAVVGAVTAYAAGNPALAGATGAVSGELMAQWVMSQLYPGRGVSELTETERQTVSVLGTLAAGLAGGVSGGGSVSALAGAEAGRNAAENNLLGGNEETQATWIRQHGVDMASCAEAPSSASCQKAMNERDAVGLALATGGVALLPGGAQAMWGLGAGANAGISYLADGTIDPANTAIAGWVNVISMGNGLVGTVGWNAAGGALGNWLGDKDPLSGAITSGVGAGFGLRYR